MMQRLILTSSTVFGTLMVVNSAYGQIIPDATTNTSVIDNCQAACDLIGGIVAGDNLFHSFEEFNIAPKASVYFNDPGVANIFSRVTGGNPSEIFGTLGVKGKANLFLLNPNGILFGEGATLDLNGSFFATTADEIQFGDRNFSAIPDEENLALLTVNPSAFLFKQIDRDGAIVLNNADLTMPPTQNIALLGQKNARPGIELNNSSISVTEGNISLGAVKNNAEIGFSEDFQLEFSADVLPGDIFLADSSKINSLNLDSLTEREIRIDANHLQIAGNSKIAATAVGVDDGAKININARSSVKIIGAGASAFQKFVIESFDPRSNAILANGVETNTFGSGNAGDIQITTPELSIDRGAAIISATNSQGKSGNINLQVADNLILKASGLVTGSNIFSSGDVGEIKIDTKQLEIEQNSVISSSTLGRGDAGSLTIDASEVVEIKDTLANAIIPTGIFTNTIFQGGNGGNLNIKTPQLILQNGGQLSASSGAITSTGRIELGGKGGNIQLDISKSSTVEGLSADGRFPSSILSDTRSSSSAGNIEIETETLSVSSNGLISASSLGNGRGGNITINASNSVDVNGEGTRNLQSLIIDGLQGKLDPANVRGGIAAFTLGEGEAGSIEIATGSLNLDRGAVVSTATYGKDSAGNLTIDASETIDVKGSAIISPSFNAGDGGNIDLQTKRLNITRGGAVASASLGSGRAGDIKVLATESIAIFEIIPDLLFSGSISTGSYGGLGTTGNLTIDTQRLSIQDGANIETNNVALGFNGTDITFNRATPKVLPKSQGKLTIDATESIEILGRAVGGNSFNQNPESHISSITSTSYPASNIEINTGKLFVSQSGAISVSSIGSGAAGALAINADSVILSDRGNINGTTVSGRGGDIDLQIQGILEIGDRSIINTDVEIEGNGGNIDIAADFVIAKSASSIAAKALRDGMGGNINIVANDIFLTADSSINADSALGINGTVKVETLLNTERNNLTRLPQQVIRADSKITQSCSSKDNHQGVFSYTGRGGLPFNPLTDFQTNETIIADLDIPTPREIERQIQPEVNSKLDLLPTKAVEADGWQINDRGKIELTAKNNSTFGFAVSYCPTANRNH